MLAFEVTLAQGFFASTAIHVVQSRLSRSVAVESDRRGWWRQPHLIDLRSPLGVARSISISPDPACPCCTVHYSSVENGPHCARCNMKDTVTATHLALCHCLQTQTSVVGGARLWTSQQLDLHTDDAEPSPLHLGLSFVSLQRPSSPTNSPVQYPHHFVVNDTATAHLSLSSPLAKKAQSPSEHAPALSFGKDVYPKLKIHCTNSSPIWGAHAYRHELHLCRCKPDKTLGITQTISS